VIDGIALDKICAQYQDGHLSENHVTIHVHCQGAEVEQHLVSSQILVDNIIAINTNNCQADKQVEVVGQVVCPASFPHPQGRTFAEFSFKTSAIKKSTWSFFPFV
jgi:hypothetical protein